MAFDLPRLQPGKKQIERLQEEVLRQRNRSKQETVTIGMEDFGLVRLTQEQARDKATIDAIPSGHRVEIIPTFKQGKLKDLIRPALIGLDVVSAPFDAFSESVGEIGAQIPKFITGNILDIELPTIATEGFGAAVEQFRDKPLWQQLPLGFADPFVGFGLAKGTLSGIRAGVKVAKAIPDASLIRLARAETAAAAGRLGPEEAASAARVRMTQPSPVERLQELEEFGLDLRFRLWNPKELEEFGLKLDSSANTFAPPLRPLEDVIPEVITTTNKLKSNLTRGINPSVGRASEVGRIATAYQRQIISSEELVDVALAAAFDAHQGQFRSLFRINRQGFFGDTGKQWQDVFSKPDNFDLLPKQREAIDDYNQVVNQEISRILEDAGIDIRMRSMPSNEYYVPRDVQEIRGIEIRRHSDPNLKRHYDEATEGFEEGIRYDVDPRNTLGLYLRWAYRKVAKKQLNDALEDFNLTAKQLVPEQIRSSYADALHTHRQLDILGRRVRKAITTATREGRTASVRVGERSTQLQRLETEMAQLDDILSDLPDLPAVATEPTRVALGQARGGIRAAEVLTQQVNTALSRISARVARISGKEQGSLEELRRLDAQFERLVQLQERIAVQPFKQLLEGRAPIPQSAAAIRQSAARTARFGQVSSEAGRVGRGVEGAQRRFINLGDAKAQLQRQIDQLKDDVQASRELTREAQQRLRITTTKVLQRERQRGVTRGKKIQTTRQLRRATEGLRSRGRAVGRAANVQAAIAMRRDILAGHLDNINQQLVEVRLNHTNTRNAYTRAIDEAKKAEVSPGALWGPNQPLEIPIAMWRNRFYPREHADLLRAVLEAETPGGLTKLFLTLANTRRFLSTVGDAAMPLIQGQPILATNPEAWGRMTLRHHQAFFDPVVQSRLIRDNISDYQWLAQHAVPIGDPEFFAALQPGQGISFQKLFNLLPKGEEAQRLLRLGGRQTFGRFQAAYNTGLGWGRVLLLKGLRESWEGTDAELAQYLRNLTGGLDSRALGTGPIQRAVEATWMAFSPRLLRSTTALTKDALAEVFAARRFIPGVTGAPSTQVGRRSVRTLATWITGVHSIYVTVCLALGDSWEEIAEGLNPLNGKRYLSRQINDDWIGVGGQMRALMQLMATMTADPTQLASLSRENPLFRFATGRGAIGPELVGAPIEALLHKDVLAVEELDGPLDLLKHTVKAHAPMAVQGVMEGEGPIAFAGGFLGGRTSPETPFDKQRVAREGAQVQLGPDFQGKDYREDLDVAQKAQVDELVSQDIKDAVAKLRTKRGVPIQLWQNANEEDRDKFKRLEGLAAMEFGAGEQYRLRLGKLREKLHNDLQDNREQHPEALQLIEEFDPSEHLFDLALTDYITATSDPKIENDLGEVNFDLLESNLEGTRTKHTPEMVEKVQTFLRRDESVLQKELRADQEVLRDYWAQVDVVIQLQPPDFRKVYEAAQEMSPRRRLQITTPLAQDNDAVIRKKEQNRRIIAAVDTAISERLHKVRLQYRDIRDALIKWEYNPSRELLQIQSIDRVLEGATP